MSKLGYFFGGALAGIVGTAVTAYVVDAISSSNADKTLEVDSEKSFSIEKDDNVKSVDAFADANNNEPFTA